MESEWNLRRSLNIRPTSRANVKLAKENPTGPKSHNGKIRNMLITVKLHLTRAHQALLRSVLPVAAGAGGTGSFLTAVVRFAVEAAGALVVVVGALRAGAAFLVPVLVTTVVPALVVLISLSRSSFVSAVARAVPGRLVCCLLCAREAGRVAVAPFGAVAGL